MATTTYFESILRARNFSWVLLATSVSAFSAQVTDQAKPNILVIRIDDISHGNEFAGSLRCRSHFMNAGMLYSPVVTVSVPATALGAMAIFLPSKNIIGQMGFLNSEDTAGYNPFEKDEGNTFLTEWKFKYGFAGLPGAHSRKIVGFST